DLARRRLGLGPVRLSAEALDALRAYAWPGNIRELENVISRVTLKATASFVRGTPIALQPAHLGSEFLGPAVASDVPQPAVPAAAVPLSLREATREFQRTVIRRALAEHDGNWAAVARALGTHRGNLHHLASRLGLR